ncbi:unnamed protein product [Closterium sp. Yama58-4]|nr:unnamed protein product [Closterium sp. Yama58-4]
MASPRADSIARKPASVKPASPWLKAAAAVVLLLAALLAASLAPRFPSFDSSGGRALLLRDVTRGAELLLPPDARAPWQRSALDAASWLAADDDSSRPARFHIRSHGFPGPVPWMWVQGALRDEFTLGGRIQVRPKFFGKEAMDSGKQLKAWRNEEIARNVNLARARNASFGSYGPNATAAFLDAFERYPVSGKSVLVIGSQRPWVESICLTFNAGTITTVDFNKPVSSHPKLRVMAVDELEGTDEVFDVAVSFSSLEHDGLGRYGDPINPFGDLQRMHKIKGLLKPAGMLFLGLPVGNDTLVYNSHRVYGPIRMPLLLSGWTLLDVFGASSLAQLYREHQHTGYHQPLMALAKENSP